MFLGLVDVDVYNIMLMSTTLDILQFMPVFWETQYTTMHLLMEMNQIVGFISDCDLYRNVLFVSKVYPSFCDSS